MQGHAILFSEMIPPPGEDAQFNAWYDEDHIPVRMAAPGFVSGQRYRRTDGPEYLAVYEVDALSAFSTPEYGKIKASPTDLTRHMLSHVSGFTRYLGEEVDVVRQPEGETLDAPILYAVWGNVPEQHLEEFDAWYAQDHIPILMQTPDWRMVRRFHITGGEPVAYNRLALHYLADVRALESPERARARATEWRRRLGSEPWFKLTYSVFERLGDRQRASRGIGA